MRHVPRVHRTNLDFIFDRIQHDEALKLRYVNTKFQAADIFTKALVADKITRLVALGVMKLKRAEKKSRKKGLR